jgi:UDPglucose--hexose-1-phosphate uridylyltransferase
MSDLRQDLVSGDWIIVAPIRARRPYDFLLKKKARIPSPKSSCPFENLRKSGNWPPITAYPGEKNWQIIVIPNKYPAVKQDEGSVKLFNRGPYRLVNGIGHHELVITRDHKKNLAHMGLNEGIRLFQAIQERYRALDKDPSVFCISTFFNWGGSAGASLYHPHYQLLTLPIIPSDIAHSLNGSHRYFKKYRRCVHCDMLRYEEKEKIRVIDKNGSAIAITPFVSREPFEVRIFPRRHQPCFEKMPARELKGVVAALQSSLRRIEKYLRDPDFNFFIHTAPLKNQQRYKHYHWHIEILPKISISAGFELSTGVEIDVVDPDQAAAILKGRKG